MKLDDLLDLTLREVLDKYVAVCNLECGYYYGIFRVEDIDEIYEEYNIEDDYPEAFEVESVISHELLDHDEVRDYSVLLRIMDNLGISKKL